MKAYSPEMRLLRLSILGFLILWTSVSHAEDLTGTPRVVDGDSIELAGEQIDLRGIDAPEIKQTCTTRKGHLSQCGMLAARALSKLTRGQVVVCKGASQDGDKPRLATCFVGPFSINEQMVLDGWALADRKRIKSYVRAEKYAEARREGIWRMTFVPPWEWRVKPATQSE